MKKRELIKYNYCPICIAVRHDALRCQPEPLESLRKVFKNDLFMNKDYGNSRFVRNIGQILTNIHSVVTQKTITFIPEITLIITIGLIF
jgi:hypothetical protein